MNEKSLSKVVINWYPGHMAKAKRQIQEKINLIDVVLEVVDSRMPKSSKLIDIDNYVSNKPRIMIMTKYDLCDKNETKKWISYYEDLGYSVIPIDLFNDSINLIIKEIMKIMAVDYGDAHTGLACCDRTQTLASPIGVIDERNFQTCVEKVAAAAVEYEVGEVVVGNPINMNGTYGPRSEKCRMFADMLQNFLEIPVVMWDERSTTVTAHNMMNDVNKRGKERKKVIDAVAAAVILQNYLDYKANLLAREKAKQEEK